MNLQEKKERKENVYKRGEEWTHEVPLRGEISSGTAIFARTQWEAQFILIKRPMTRSWTVEADKGGTRRDEEGCSFNFDYTFRRV